jgi:hypothetical protein
MQAITRHLLKDRILCLTTWPKILGAAVVIILFVSLIALSVKAKKFGTERKMLFAFPSLIMIAEIIRYIAIATCEVYYEAPAELRFYTVNLPTCIVCLAGQCIYL